MDLEYDRKFEEMKKYIPFLESMISRLENTSKGSANPRQAQLDKIRSLRDLLLDKKKRMKMDNLLKCEQVLINLYAKVEQRDTLPGIQPASEVISPNEKTDLNLARNKLKTVTSKTHEPDTLPEIARATETEVICTPGSKEPALFQRRPNKGSLSPIKHSSKDKSPQKSSSKRNYTRVLVSPDRSDRIERLWSPSDGATGDQNLFSRRSPPRASRRYSPSYHKRERKKFSKQESHSRKSKDLNITLKVPEERLNSLNTKDILSRIINCSDGDVDIATLRELRTQILGELQHTGANEDISDLILKSYRNKKIKKSQSKKKADVEEGELSDSESEAIENIYGNLVVLEKDKNKDASSNQTTSSTEQDQVSRKIQICLVINSDKEETSPEASKTKNATENQIICDITDFEMFDDNNSGKSAKPAQPAYSAINTDLDKESANLKTSTSLSPVKTNMNNSTDIITVEDVDNEEIPKTKCGGEVIDMHNFDLHGNSNSAILTEIPKSASEPVPAPFKVNFYKPISSDVTETFDSHDEKSSNKYLDQRVPLDMCGDKVCNTKKNEPLDKSEVDVRLISKDKSSNSTENSETTKIGNQDVVSTNTPNLNSEATVNRDAEIPLLNEPTVQPAKKDIVSEIDILQALKNEILSDSISIPGAEAVTPALHQPKVTKVSNAQELPKKRISIESYKRKAVPSNKLSLFVNNPGIAKKESMKQSLKLTEKEVERFNLISKIALDDDSDDDKHTDLKSPDEVDLAPKSPDMDFSDNTPVSPPVIIPADPVKMVIVNSKADVDMRTLPMMSPNTSTITSPFAPSTPIPAKNDVNIDVRNSVDKPEVKRPVIPVDPRIRKDALLPTPPVAYPNMTPSRIPNVAPNMTPSRTPNMTPNGRSFEYNPNRPFNADDNARKHVYAPMFPVQDNQTDRKSVWEPSERSPADKPIWEMSNADRNRSNSSQRDDGPRSRYNDSNPDMGYNRTRNDRNGRDEYNRQEGPQSSNYYPRSDCPATPTPSFGRAEAPSTPSHYFGRSECPRTPSHPFGRSEPSNHSFGMSEPPRTPSHPFGRSEAPMTPSHPFGRSEAPMTPSHPFGRSDYSCSSNPSPKYGKAQDPRLNRSYDHDNSRRDTGSYNDRNRYYRNDPRNFNREQSVSRNESKPYTPEQTYRREQMSRREPSVGRSLPNPGDSDRLYSRDRGHGSDNSRTYAEVGSRRTFQREPSAGRSLPDYRARASSVGRSIRNNELSVESHAGRAFTIDTSVNSTFQKFLDSHRGNDISFDARRQRASSVGRSLAREPSVGRTLPMQDNNKDRFKRAQSVGRDATSSRTERSFKDVKAEFESYRNNDRSFKRDINKTQTASFTDNANSRDPRVRRESYDKQQDTKHGLNKTQVREPHKDVKKFNYRDPRQRKEQKLKEKSNYQHEHKHRKRTDSHDRHSYGISSDSGTKTPAINLVKNYKIPKIKRPEPEEKPVKETVPDKVQSKKSSALSDVKDSKQKSTSSQVKPDKKTKEEKKKPDKMSTKKADNDDEKNILPVNTEKRVTRRSGRNHEKETLPVPSEDDEIIPTRTRRFKKVIYDSDSDETVSNTKDTTSKTKMTGKTVSPKNNLANNEKKTVQLLKAEEKQQDNTEIGVVKENSNTDVEPEGNQETMDCSFGLDDMTLFPDNIITDPVLDNINALIADLDNDLDTSKAGTTCNDLFNDISIENMLEKITSSPIKPETKKTGESTKIASDVVKKDLFDSFKNITETLPEKCTSTSPLKSETKNSMLESAKITEETAKEDLFDKLKNEIGLNKSESKTNKTDCHKSGITDEKQSQSFNDDQSTSLQQIDSQSDPHSKLINPTHVKNDIEPVVSTSVNEEEPCKKDESIDSEVNPDGRSTPDSTNDAQIATKNTSETPGEKPDSTIEKQCEMNSDISSTHDAEDKTLKENADMSKEQSSQIDSIGSLLSILQDKSKIKELLSMLGDQSGENEKIKKKLEKLSEIVSDDEDTNEKIEEDTAKIKTSEDSELKHNKEDDQEDLPHHDIELDKPKELESQTLTHSEPNVHTENDQLKNSPANAKKSEGDKFDKLSEIVSDDEDTNDKIEEDTAKVKTSEDSGLKHSISRRARTHKEDDQEDLPHHDIEPDKLKEPHSETLTQSEANVHTENEQIKNSPADAKKSEGDKFEIEPTSSDEKTDSKEIHQDLEQQDESNDMDDEGNSEPEDDNEEEGDKEPDSPKPRKKKVKKPKRLKTGKFKKGKPIKKVVGEGKRVTRSEAAGLLTRPPPKKPSRELRQLQESIKEMFMSDAILNASGIRMCRLAKLVDEKTQKNEASVAEPEPIVVLEKVKHFEENEVTAERTMRKKPGPRLKVKHAVTSLEDKNNREDDKPLIKYKPGPKSKTKIPQCERDPYDFETDNIIESKSSDKGLDSGSDSESESLASSKSFGSTELLVELKKKPKRKRGGWKTGVIKPKNKKRKVELKRPQSTPPKPTPETKRTFTIPDLDCFTDKNYCFSKDSTEYSCRLCESTHSRQDIVFHYKKHHPHAEIPLSRMSPEIAREAIEQCGDVDFGVISKIPTEKYTCRFCFIDFGKRRAVLETFFWHVVSMHTGEYKQLCSECINVERCPFNLDIPPPPKDVKGQLIGYICGKCNYTQLSLENLKMHVINRHNDTETEVYTINFAVMTKQTINSLMRRTNLDSTRTTRSTRSNQSITEPSDDRSEITESDAEVARSDKKSEPEKLNKTRKFSFSSKISFENDDNASDISNFANTESSLVKYEQEDVDEDDNQQDNMDEPFREDSGANEEETEPSQTIEKSQIASDDIMDYPHFKINYTEAGNKEYVCCINGKDSHYKTGLLISMKKHVQLKHSETWDGYCFVCKVIVTSQGQHKFSECLMHFLDSHIDNFPVLEKVTEPEEPVTPAATPELAERAPTPYINVRPLSDLVEPVEPPVDVPAMPVIDSVISLVPVVPETVEPPRPSPTYPVTRKETQPPKEYKYEEAQAEIMSKKHRVVLDAMMTPEKLVQVFKCAGRFCSFTTDSAEDALMHASTHQRVGGTNALLCAYCDFDSSGNSIDLVSHVFKSHGRCQVVCALCFYRAAASQLVAAHITRVHGTTPERRCVLKTNNVPALCEPAEENLSREIAVPKYICKQSDQGETCLFRIVTHTKFWEHLTQKHANATAFNCYICSTMCGDATALVLHLKTHGLKLYHCTLCVFGADNEPELLAHASAKHPAKTPQAYIRTICGMSGYGSFKILPLVELKKAALNPEEITPIQAKENPVREAERSIELEKLIGHMLDAPTTTEQVQEEESATPISELLPETTVDDAISNLLDDPSSGMATLIPVPQLLPLSAQTPPRQLSPAPSDTNISKVVTPVLKQEPMDATPDKNNSDVICLDSDDEDSKQGIINLSDEEKGNEPPPSFSGVLAANKIKDLFKCGKCKKIAKSNAGFRRHVSACYKIGEKYKCAHCPFEIEEETVYFMHFNVNHFNPACLKCPICPHTETTMYMLKRHIKAVHEPSPFPSDKEYVLGKGNSAKAKNVKRKSSGPTGGTPSKQKRYGPSDIDKLPINPILDESVFCDICEFNTKVRLNMVRHLQLHAEHQPVPQTAPVNPVPHLESNEKHFDKMVNLASSSIAMRAPEKPAKEPTPTVLIPSDKASRLPQYVPERFRYTCGASGCTYISVDEAMFKCHWETLHSGTYDYHCVHCPPHQFLDKSKPLTAMRIIAHLKMHDIRLYACSACPYYHHRKQLLDKHMVDAHKGDGTVLVVREESTQPSPTTPTSAPTMDLKPWQCGLCKFKSMLRQEVVEHCAKMHQSKMQYKCAYCPFRTSTPENVTKHQTTSHPNREHEVFYFYYREGSIPHGPDGTPHWQKQRQKTGVENVKDEVDPPPVTTGTILPRIRPPATVNLNIVKQEIPDGQTIQDSVEELCKKYGDFCEPNGLNYKCSLCKVVVEDSKEAMQSHLFEELQYRKWACRLCMYKAFHQTGLKEHMWTEHKKNQEPIELPIDVNVESWVSKQLDYQEDLIKKNREKLAQQKMLDERPPAPTTSKAVEVQNSASKISMEKLEKIFGSLGAPINMQFCCPKCLFKTNDDKIIQQHLEAELTRIRWCCSNCPNHFSTYHEAQFHCKSVHTGQNSRPVEAARDPNIRSAWVNAVIRVQKLSMNCITVTSEPNRFEESTDTNDDENSLLVIRYEEDVPTPEEETLRQRRGSDSDDESLVIDEQALKKGSSSTKCDYCDFTTKYPSTLEAHELRHYNLKPFACPYCNYSNHRLPVLQHINTLHPNQPMTLKKTEKPTGPPLILDLPKLGKKMAPVKKPEETSSLVCLVCEKLLSEPESKNHTHDQTVPMFAKRGDIVVKCSECLMLFLDNVEMQQHFTSSHPDMSINYAYYKTDHDSRGFLFCSHCNQRFSYLIDLKSHNNLVHSSLKLKYTSKPFAPSSSDDSSGEPPSKKKTDEAS